MQSKNNNKGVFKIEINKIYNADCMEYMGG